MILIMIMLIEIIQSKNALYSCKICIGNTTVREELMKNCTGIL